jgi:hypothetical protein
MGKILNRKSTLLPMRGTVLKRGGEVEPLLKRGSIRSEDTERHRAADNVVWIPVPESSARGGSRCLFLDIYMYGLRWISPLNVPWPW